MEALHRDFLARVRRAVALMESQIALDEFLMKLFADSDTPKQVAWRQQQLDESRKNVEKWKKIQKDLEQWEQERKTKPGLETD